MDRLEKILFVLVALIIIVIAVRFILVVFGIPFYTVHTTNTYGMVFLSIPFLMFLFFIAITILAVFFIILLVKELVEPVTVTHNDEAIRILKERYAKGEISKEEYEEKMRDLFKY